MADTPPRSPEGLQLRGTPSSAVRLSKKVAFAAVAVLTVIVGIILSNASKGPPKASDSGEAKNDLQPALNAASSLTNVPDIVSAPVNPPPLRSWQPPAAPAASGAPVKDLDADARMADTAVPNFGSIQSTHMSPAVAGYSATAAPQANTADVPADGTGGAGGGTSGDSTTTPSSNTAPGAGRGDGAGGGVVDLNHQSEKASFLSARQTTAYLHAQLQAPLSPFELKTGTVIPGILVGEANSDLPGDLIAQVSQNVYDTATGNHLLIPQGARLYGHYDSQVTFGQGRLLVRWERLIYPNAYTLELQGMPGNDQGGASGFEDEVNNHYGRLFGWALATSVLSVGSQLAQPQQTNALVVPSNQQVASAAVSQQMLQLGAQIASRNMQVQPTIIIRKGYRMLVMINKDIVFPGSYAP
jgi:type IV secretion system protein TrbI